MMTDGFDVDQWLNDAGVSEGQRDEIRQAETLIDARFPDDRDHQEEREAALSAAVQVILGDDTLESTVARWGEARRREAETRAAATGAIVASAVQGVPEARIAARTGVARDTVRKAVGK